MSIATPPIDWSGTISGETSARAPVRSHCEPAREETREHGEKSRLPCPPQAPPLQQADDTRRPGIRPLRAKPLLRRDANAGCRPETRFSRTRVRARPSPPSGGSPRPARRSGRPSRKTPPAAASGQRGAERVQLEVVARQPPRRQVALEHLAEADEEAGADRADDLALATPAPSRARRARARAATRGRSSSARYSTPRRLPLARRRVLGELRQVAGRRIVGGAELPQERPVDDEVGVAADRAREVAVRRAREARVAEVPRVVARLLQRPEDERRERLPPPPRLRRRTSLTRSARLGRDARRVGGREPLGRRRRRNVEVGELREQELDRLRVGPLVHAVERLAPAAGEQAGDRLVRDGSSAPRRARALRARPRARRARRRRRPSNSNSTSGLSTRSAPRANRRRRSSAE